MERVMMMSNSPLVKYTKISPNRSKGRVHATHNPKGVIDKITIHHTAGKISIETLGEIFAPTSRQASSNYGVGDDGRIGMYCEEKDRSWCSSSAANDYRAITLEVVNSQNGGNWPISDKALAATIDLCVDICKRNGIKKLNFTGDKNGNLTMHKWFANTNCPGPYLESKFPYIAAEVNKRLGDSGHPIIGVATAAVGQAKTWAKNNGATDLFISLADIFWKVAIAAGINPVMAYAQSAKETGYGKFKGVLNESYMNPCGMKTKSGGGDSDPNAHQKFASWEQGIQAQIDHLALYAGAKGYPKAGTPDPRHFPYLKGTAPTVESLGGKWAPAASYGNDIAAMMAKLESTKAAPVTPTAPETSTLYYVQTGAYSIKANADAQYNKVKAAGFDALIKQSGGLYRVQVGAYSVKANADAMAAKLKAKGFETYITVTAGTIVQPGSAPAKKIAVGSKVKVNSSATKYSTGQTIPAWVKANTYTVQQISGEKALLKEITSWVNLKDLTAM